jgi:hypothetical protein
MRDRDLLDSFERFCAVDDVMHGVKNIGAVIPCPACVADADDDVFKDDESFLVLEGLALDPLGTDGAVAVFAAITVHGINTSRLQTAFA